MKRLPIIVLLASGLCYCSTETGNTNSGGKKMALELKTSLELVSSAFSDGMPIPVKYTADGQDISPPLKWTAGPATTKGYCLICDDPDAPSGTWVHWVVYNIPPHVLELPEGLPKDPNLQEGIRQGITSFGSTGYGGPAPPKGKQHHYYFKLYALDSVIDLKPAATEAQLVKAIQGRVIAEAKLMGTYQR
jgi:Raf kinase inhibitor-like YbhB/YbcL family protein